MTTAPVTAPSVIRSRSRTGNTIRINIPTTQIWNPSSINKKRTDEKCQHGSSRSDEVHFESLSSSSLQCPEWQEAPLHQAYLTPNIYARYIAIMTAMAVLSTRKPIAFSPLYRFYLWAHYFILGMIVASFLMTDVSLIFSPNWLQVDTSLSRQSQ